MPSFYQLWAPNSLLLSVKYFSISSSGHHLQDRTLLFGWGRFSQRGTFYSIACQLPKADTHWRSHSLKGLVQDLADIAVKWITDTRTRPSPRWSCITVQDVDAVRIDTRAILSAYLRQLD